MFAKRSTIRCQFRRTSDGIAISGGSEFTARPLWVTASLTLSETPLASADLATFAPRAARIAWTRVGTLAPAIRPCPAPEGCNSPAQYANHPTKVHRLRYRFSDVVPGSRDGKLQPDDTIQLRGPIGGHFVWSALERQHPSCWWAVGLGLCRSCACCDTGDCQAAPCRQRSCTQPHTRGFDLSRGAHRSRTQRLRSRFGRR